MSARVRVEPVILALSESDSSKWLPKWNKKSADFILHVLFLRPISSYKWQIHEYFRQNWLQMFIIFSLKVLLSSKALTSLRKTLFVML